MMGWRAAYLVEVGVGSAGQEAVKLHEKLKVHIVGLHHTYLLDYVPRQAQVAIASRL